MVDTGFSDGVIFDSETIDLGAEGYQMSEARLVTQITRQKATAWERVPFSLAEMPISYIRAIRQDLTPIRKRLSYPIEFVAGVPCLNDRKLTFTKHIQHVELAMSDDEDSVLMGDELQIHLDRYDCPMIDLRLPILGHRQIALDTCCDFPLCLTQERIESLVRLGAATKIASTSTFLDGLGTVEESDFVYILREVSIGETTITNVPVLPGELEAIGTGIIRYFDVSLDLKRKLARFTLPDGQNARIEFSRKASGLSCRSIGRDRIRVEVVEENSAGDAAGLHSGDIIYTIDGNPVSELSHWDRIDVFSQAGTTLELSVERDGELRDVALKLRYDIPYPPEWPPEAPEFNPE